MLVGRHLPSTMSVGTDAMMISNAGIASHVNTIAPRSRRFLKFVYKPQNETMPVYDVIGGH